MLRIQTDGWIVRRGERIDRSFIATLCSLELPPLHHVVLYQTDCLPWQKFFSLLIFHDFLRPLHITRHKTQQISQLNVVCLSQHHNHLHLVSILVCKFYHYNVVNHVFMTLSLKIQHFLKRVFNDALTIFLVTFSESFRYVILVWQLPREHSICY